MLFDCSVELRSPPSSLLDVSLTLDVGQQWKVCIEFYEDSITTLSRCDRNPCSNPRQAEHISSTKKNTSFHCNSIPD